MWDSNLLVESLCGGRLAFFIRERNTLAYEAWDFIFLLATSSGDGPLTYLVHERKISNLQGSRFIFSCRKLEWWSFEHLGLQGPWLIFSSSINLGWWPFGFSHAWKRNLGLQQPTLFFFLQQAWAMDAQLSHLWDWKLNLQCLGFFFLVASSGDVFTMRRKPRPMVFFSSSKFGWWTPSFSYLWEGPWRHGIFFLVASLDDSHSAFLSVTKRLEPWRPAIIFLFLEQIQEKVAWLHHPTKRKLGPWRLRIIFSYNKFRQWLCDFSCLWERNLGIFIFGRWAADGCPTFLVHEK